MTMFIIADPSQIRLQTEDVQKQIDLIKRIEELQQKLNESIIPDRDKFYSTLEEIKINISIDNLHHMKELVKEFEKQINDLLKKDPRICKIDEKLKLKPITKRIKKLEKEVKDKQNKSDCEYFYKSIDQLQRKVKLIELKFEMIDDTFGDQIEEEKEIE